jgi:hypothetical protein
MVRQWFRISTARRGIVDPPEPVTFYDCLSADKSALEEAKQNRSFASLRMTLKRRRIRVGKLVETSRVNYSYVLRRLAAGEKLSMTPIGWELGHAGSRVVTAIQDGTVTSLLRRGFAAGDRVVTITRKGQEWIAPDKIAARADRTERDRNRKSRRKVA